MAELSSLQRLRPARVAALVSESAGIRASIECDGQAQSMCARLLVAADGTRSLARSSFGIGAQEHGYGQTLFVCSIAAEHGSDGTAYERFTAQGPVALLPMAGASYE